MKSQKGIILSLIVFCLLAVGAAGSSAAFASSEIAESSITLPTVSLAENSSYMTEDYTGVLHLDVSDSSVVRASTDGKGRVIITAVGTGSTTVSYWYRQSDGASWTAATLPVKVSGKSDQPYTIGKSDTGIVFPLKEISLTPDQTYTPDGMKVNGISKGAGTFLWVSSSDEVAEVEKKTGKITAVSSGSTTVYAIDPITKSCASILVTVS